MRMPKTIMIDSMVRMNDALMNAGVYDLEVHERIRYGISMEDEDAYRELQKYLLLICSNISLYEKG